MHLVTVGLSHRTAPVEVRERIAFNPREIPEALRRIQNISGCREVAILSTCNRTEIYSLAEDRSLSQYLSAFLNRRYGSDDDLRPYLFTLWDRESAEHLIRVASGLDSMVLGEGQILSQVKKAMQIAADARTLGPVLSALFRKALTVGKRARSETNIARGAVSVSHVAVELAKEIFGDLRHCTALIVGAGETGKLTMRLLAEAGVHQRIVTNRTLERAQYVAEVVGGQAVPFEQLSEVMKQADIVISSTGAHYPIITRLMVEKVVRQRRGKPLFLIDIAVPRDVETSVGEIDSVFLFNIDDLQLLVERNLGDRKQEVDKVEAIVREELEEFMSWWRSQSAVPIVTALLERCEKIRQEELQKAQKRLKDLTPEEMSAVEYLTQILVKRLLHPSIESLKALAQRRNAEFYLEVAQWLLGLKDGQKETDLEKVEQNTLVEGAPPYHPPQRRE